MRTHILAVFVALAICSVRASEYYGVKVGNVNNASYGLTGEVYLVNSSYLQIVNFHLHPAREKLDVSFHLSTENDVAKPTEIYQILQSPNGEYAKPIGNNLDGGFSNARLVVKIPGNLQQWTYFGVVAELKWFFLSAVELKNKRAPEPFCCITDPVSPNRGLVGTWYNAGAGPIHVFDAKTLHLPRFTFEGSKPPDGWIYTGRGKVDQSTGQKAMILGRDSKALHCPLREDWIGDKDITVRLADGQTVYDIDYLSVYCFAVGVDFGHVAVRLTREKNPLPASIPPIRHTPPPDGVEAWQRPRVIEMPQQGRPVDLQFTLGPPAGAKARAMRGICDQLLDVWFVQGQMTPEIWVERGHKYRLKVFGGAKHPLYITSEPTGGYADKPVSEQQAIKNFAGGDGQTIGSLCRHNPINDHRASKADSFETFDEFRHFLQLDCQQPRQPAIISWTPDADTPNIVFYASFSTFNMGGPIRVCNRISGTPADPKCL